MSEVQEKIYKRLIRKEEVLDKTSLKSAILDRRVREGTFPMPVRLGDRSIAWWEHEIDEFMENLPRGRGKPVVKVRRALLNDPDDGEAAP